MEGIETKEGHKKPSAKEPRNVLLKSAKGGDLVEVSNNHQFTGKLHPSSSSQRPVEKLKPVVLTPRSVSVPKAVCPPVQVQVYPWKIFPGSEQSSPNSDSGKDELKVQAAENKPLYESVYSLVRDTRPSARIARPYHPHFPNTVVGNVPVEAKATEPLKLSEKLELALFLNGHGGQGEAETNNNEVRHLIEDPQIQAMWKSRMVKNPNIWANFPFNLG